VPNPLPRPDRLVLWDVDGTLVVAGPAAQTAFDLAVASVFGRAPGPHDVHMAGKTDPQIALEILASMAISEPEARRHLPAVLEALEKELEAATDLIREHGRVLPGAEPVLRRLASDRRVVQTVLTGNLAANARLKLAAFGLDRWLDLELGATGSDDGDRLALVAVAMAKAKRRLGFAFEPRQVWVVGDTPLDLIAARAGGTRCLLVGTGRYGYQELAGSGADSVLPDLTDTERVVAILTGS
jgi:phosphoglycolate phosphatase